MITPFALFLVFFTSFVFSARRDDEQQGVHLEKKGGSKDPADVDATSHPEAELDPPVQLEPQLESRHAGPIHWMLHPSKCMDVIGGSSRNGNHIGLFECLAMNIKEHANQQFILPTGSQGPLRWSAHPSKCMDVAGGEDFNGNHIGIFDCLRNGTHPNQQFILPADGVGPIRWAKHPHKCMDVMGGRDFNGNKIGLFDCLQNGTHANMQFGFPQLSSKGHTLIKAFPAVQRHLHPVPQQNESVSTATDNSVSSEFGKSMNDWIEEHLHLHTKAHGIEQQLQDDALYWGAVGGLFVQVGLCLALGAMYVIWLWGGRKSKDT